MRIRDHVRIALTDPFCIYMLLLFGIIVAVFVLFFAGLRDVAWLVSVGGTTLVVVGGILYTAARDPEDRYAGASFRVRLSNLLTFKR